MGAGTPPSCPRGAALEGPLGVGPIAARLAVVPDATWGRGVGGPHGYPHTSGSRRRNTVPIRTICAQRAALLVCLAALVLPAASHAKSGRSIGALALPPLTVGSTCPVIPPHADRRTVCDEVVALKVTVLNYAKVPHTASCIAGGWWVVTFGDGTTQTLSPLSMGHLIAVRRYRNGQPGRTTYEYLIPRGRGTLGRRHQPVGVPRPDYLQGRLVKAPGGVSANRAALL